MNKLDGFEMSLQSAKALLDKKIRLRWVDEWGEAYYVGRLLAALLYTGDETPSSVLLELEAGDALVVPIGHETDIWVLDD